MSYDNEKIMLADIAMAGFCRQGSIDYADRLGLDFFAAERGEITVGDLRAKCDPLCDRIVTWAEKRLGGELAVPAASPELVVTMADLRAVGYCRDGVAAHLPTIGLSWDELKRGRLTVAMLRGSACPKAEMLAVAAEARAARKGG